ncbi:MAG: helix-turn-helix transcriptional regulator, partial [Pseudomonadota bacterium]
RERDVLTLLGLGQSRAQAADRLKISEHTFRVYVDTARHKLGALNTTHAVAVALNSGAIAI